LNKVAPAKIRQAAAKILGFANAFDMSVSYILLPPRAVVGASSSQGFGGIVGPTSRTGAGVFGLMFRRLKLSFDGDEALMLALNSVAAANKSVAAAKSLVFAKVLDIGYAPG
jgi:hypothetical protein